MANPRRDPSGRTTELEERKDAKYEPDQEADVRQWIEAVVGEPLADEDTGIDSFHLSLKDGTHLCKLANKLQPGSIRQISTSPMAFNMMENINHFLNFCKSYGMDMHDLFTPVDLYEKQNIPQVIHSLYALGLKAETKGFDGPVIHSSELPENQKELSEEQLREGLNIIGLQMGSSQ